MPGNVEEGHYPAQPKHSMTGRHTWYLGCVVCCPLQHTVQASLPGAGTAPGWAGLSWAGQDKVLKQLYGYYSSDSDLSMSQRLKAPVVVESKKDDEDYENDDEGDEGDEEDPAYRLTKHRKGFLNRMFRTGSFKDGATLLAWQRQGRAFMSARAGQ